MNVDAALLTERQPQLPEVVEAPAKRYSEAEVLDVIVALGADWGTPLPKGAKTQGELVGGVPHGRWELYYPTSDRTESGA